MQQLEGFAIKGKGQKHDKVNNWSSLLQKKTSKNK
jgi:hypothetical protein